MFDETNGKLIGSIILVVVAGGGYNLGRRMGLWTSRRRVFFFLWASAAAPLLFVAIDIGVEGEDWIGAAVVFVLAMLIAGPLFALFGSIIFTAGNSPGGPLPKTKKNLKKTHQE